MTARKPASFIIAVAFVIGIAVWTFARAPVPDEDTQPKQRLGLMTSLPIYWNEGVGLGDMLADERPEHWVKEVLERRFTLVPLDILAAPDSIDPSDELAGLNLLILAQPNALPGDEINSILNAAYSGSNGSLKPDYGTTSPPMAPAQAVPPTRAPGATPTAPRASRHSISPVMELASRSSAATDASSPSR